MQCAFLLVHQFVHCTHGFVDGCLLSRRDAELGLVVGNNAALTWNDTERKTGRVNNPKLLFQERHAHLVTCWGRSLTWKPEPSIRRSIFSAGDFCHRWPWAEKDSSDNAGRLRLHSEHLQVIACTWMSFNQKQMNTGAVLPVSWPALPGPWTRSCWSFHKSPGTPGWWSAWSLCRSSGCGHCYGLEGHTEEAYIYRLTHFISLETRD